MIQQMNATETLSADDLREASVNNNLSERSEETQEIIAARPGFVEKWALFIFLLLLLLLIGGTWLVKYPDTLQGAAVLTGNNAPKEIIAKESGRLTALFVKNNQQVSRGEIMGWLESTASAKEVIDLAERLKNSTRLLANGPAGSVSALFNNRFENLGELQLPYQTFVAAWQQYNDYLVNGYYYKRKHMLHSDITSLQSIRQMSDTQRSLSQKDNELGKKSFEMNESLFKDKVISAEEYRVAQSALISKQLILPQMDANRIIQDNQIRDKQKEIDQLNHDIIQQQKTFEEALQTLKSAVSDWLKRYTLQAPADGQVVFVLPVQQYQYIEQGKLLGYVTPPDTAYYAQVRLSQYNFGKLDTGMVVQLRFDAYPYQEMGFVTGKLDYISRVAIDSGFLGTIKLDKGLITNQNKEIPYKSGLKAQAIIITRDMRLLNRLYYSIVKTTSMNK